MEEQFRTINPTNNGNQAIVRLSDGNWNNNAVTSLQLTRWARETLFWLTDY